MALTPAQLFGALTQAASEHASDRMPLGVYTLSSIFARAQELLDKQGCDSFDDFWAIYPRKDSKDAALRAWKRMEGDRHRSAILTNVRWRLTAKEWEPYDRERKSFIPHAATYLNARRWLDPMTVERKGYGDV
jgi:hypothetical protein